MISCGALGRGHAERLGAGRYLAVIEDNHGAHYELPAMSPHDAEAAARAFCERNGIALAAFAIDHVMAEWHAEAAAWLATPRQVRAEYRRAV